MDAYTCIMILDGAQPCDAETLADAVCFAAKNRVPLSTGTMGRTVRFALDTGIVERRNGRYVPVAENILELEEMGFQL